MSALGGLIGTLARPVLGKRGLALGSLALDWEAVVGPEVGARSRPMGLRFAASQRGEGTLTLRVESGHALLLQHREPLLIARINEYFGYAAVARLRFVQGPVGGRLPERPAPPDPAATRAVEANVAAIEDGPLREALRRFGLALSAPRRSDRRDPRA